MTMQKTNLIASRSGEARPFWSVMIPAYNTGPLDVPAIGLYRNVMLEQVARHGAQPFDLRSQAEMFADPRQPLPQQRL